MGSRSSNGRRKHQEHRQRHGRISRQDLLTACQVALGIGKTVASKGLDYARIQGWIKAVPAENAKHREVDFIPGDPLEQDDPEEAP